MEILDQFGINVFLLGAQIVNFLILLFLLNKFLYKPLLKVLDVRKQKIADSLKNAEDIERRLEKINDDREKELKKAAEEAREVLKDANQAASIILAEAHQKAEASGQNLMKKAEEAIGLEREKLKQEIRAELAELVVIGLQQVTGKVLTAADQKDLIDKSLKTLGK